MFTLLCGASKDFMKAFKAFIKPFEAPQRSVEIKSKVIFFLLSGIGTGRVNLHFFLYEMKQYPEMVQRHGKHE